MENKGQASAEYLLLLVVILIILAAVTMPLVGNSISNTMAVSTTSDATNAIKTISDAVNLVYANGPGAKRTVNVYIPQRTTVSNNATAYPDVTLSGNFIGMNLTNIAGGPYNSPHIMNIATTDGRSDIFVYANTNYPVNVINGANLASGWYKVTVYWPVGNRTIAVNFSAT
ncbi:MAG: class III signal peptide-containing protein [Methanobacteriaceae archaeon]|nr:class III signal peptide-containing protein [Methanobacteriaceae archaeon]